MNKCAKLSPSLRHIVTLRNDKKPGLTFCTTIGWPKGEARCAGEGDVAIAQDAVGAPAQEQRGADRAEAARVHLDVEARADSVEALGSPARERRLAQVALPHGAGGREPLDLGLDGLQLAFGVDEEQIDEVVDVLASGSRIRVSGVHIFAGTQILDAEVLAMGGEPPATFECAADAAGFDVGQPPRVSGWGLQPTNTRVLPDAVAGIAKTDLDNLKLKWAFAFPGANRARSQPTIAGGAIYVGSHNGLVYALDQDTGCVRWTYESAAEVRTGIIVDDWEAGAEAAQPRAYFGDVLGNVYAIDAASGSGIWRVRADEHPNATITGSPSLHDGRLFVPVSSLEVSLAADPSYECCTGRGSVLALDAATGEVLWKTYTIEETPVVQSQNRSETNMIGPSGAMVWNSPTIDEKRNQLYIGTGENMSSPATLTSDAIFAMDLDTGKVNWVFQATPNDAWNTACGAIQPDSCPEEDGPDFDFGAGTLLLTASDVGDLVVGGQKSGKVHALDPDTGKLVWQTRVGRGGIQGGVHFGMSADADRLYVPITDMADGRTYPNPGQKSFSSTPITSGSIFN